MCASATEQNVHVLLCTVIHNRLAAPFVSTFPAEMDLEQREAFEALRLAAATRTPALLEPLANTQPGSDLHRWPAF